MSKRLTALAVILLPVVLGFGLTLGQELSPQQVVERYCESASAGDLKRVASYTARTPRVYHELRMRETIAAIEKIRKAAAESELEPDERNAVWRDPSSGDESTLTWVNETFPKSLSSRPESRQVLREITGVWVKGNQARVRAALGYAAIPGERGPSDWEFLLYKGETGGWKLFQVQLPTTNVQEKYGTPDEQIVTRQ